MIILLSPAKTLDMSPAADVAGTQPRLLQDAESLVSKLRRRSRGDLQELMSISEKLAELNYRRYKEFGTPFSDDNAKPALYAFRGDVYQDLDADTLDNDARRRADAQLRILSGLYGVLRPRDLMQAYRLEMGTRLPSRRGKNLYEYWGDRITDLLNEDLAAEGSGTVLNLASNEYFRSINTGRLNGKVVDVDFKDRRDDGSYRIISFNAKRARGKLARLILQEGTEHPDRLKELVANDYVYNEEMSTEGHLIFTRD